MNLNIKTNYNTNLFYITNAASRWSEDVNYLVLDMLKEECRWDQSYQESLEHFASIRKEYSLDWDYDAQLFPWAYNGFRVHEIFSLLEPPMRKIEELEFLDGRSMQVFLSEKVNFLNQSKDQILSTYKNLTFKNFSLDDIISRLVKLNPEYADIRDEIDCYLVLHTDRGFGAAGANGGVIFNEVKTINPHFSDDAEVIFHEYLHITVKISKRVLNDSRFKKFFNKVFPGKVEQSHGGIFEELFVYSACNEIFGRADAEEKVRKYSNIKWQNVVDMIFIWKNIEDFGKIVLDLIEARIEPEEAYYEMVERYLGYVRDTSL